MKSSEKLSFVIHKHDATSLHYDFRLEVDGKMPSWAIPKGPTLDPKMKRLAMKVDNHELEYRHFEGNLPEGHYGAGPVMIWDEGYYFPEEEVAKGIRQQIKDKKEGDKIIQAGLKKGEIKFELHGQKLNGSFALVKTKYGVYPERSRRSPKNAWLLIKHADEHAKIGFDANDYDFSAVSGKSIEQIRKTL